MEDGEFGSEKTSKYNSAIDQLKRLDEIWRNITSNVRVGNFYMWNLNLDRVWTELAGDYQEGSEEEKKIIAVNKEIISLSPLLNATNLTFNQISAETKIKQSKQYLVLIKKEILLRRFQNAQGKGSAYSSGDEDDFE